MSLNKFMELVDREMPGEADAISSLAAELLSDAEFYDDTQLTTKEINDLRGSVKFADSLGLDVISANTI